VVRVLVNHDLIAIPEPTGAETDVEGSHAEEEATKPEALGAPSRKMPDMTRAKAAGEVAMFPGMIQMVIGVVLAGVVSDPLTVGVNMGSFRMSRFVGKFLFWSVVFGSFLSFRWRRTVSGNVLLAANITTPAAMLFTTTLLRETRQ